ncbi:transporter substrate-binding domain-containing protein [Variovorax ginsengisoli]|uniref:Polar amino acid transport system substrate-binding protein n=1 Tax=Variovorax ginsengisoli TaxID=363844 RepID=A0ABT9SCX7_9BURK|nr:transporter substrate-binding domain-containing protein [Variovorax ginsengisoli]MDP9902201.1 polar amino acid transport system substrate-binding protein [Variovorax ginsengisoli]
MSAADFPPIPSSIVRAFAPTGVLRASINLGNPILANRDATTGLPSGVSIDLAHALAARLGVPVELVVFDKAAQSVEAVKAERADIGFFAIDPARSDGLRFTAPYVLIEGSYLVPGASALQDNAEVDRAGARVGVGSGSAYDLFLTRELKAAHIERVFNAQAVVDALRAGTVDVAAGIRKQLATISQADASLRLLPGRFMVIQQAMGLPAGRGEEAAAALAAFVEHAKASGFVADALARHHIDGADVAP